MTDAVVLGFDFGMARIGIAVGQRITRTASPLFVLRARDGTPDWRVIERVISEWRPERLIVGLPLNMDGTGSDMSRLAEKFGRRLEGRFGLPVDMVDERLTSRAARDYAGEGEWLDAIAAKLILETWLQDS